MEMASEFTSINTISPSPISSPTFSSNNSATTTNTTSASLVFALEATKRERDVKADDAQRLSSLATAQARELETLREPGRADSILAEPLAQLR